MGFIVIEGLDGSGKSTQVDLLKQYLNSTDERFEFIHFPTLDSPIFGDLISRFLRGELGSLNQVDPYLVSLLFAGDRHNKASEIQKWLNDGKFVLNDRYVYSNIGFQCAKTSTEEESEQLFEWILNLEYNYYKIPRPDLSIFLDVPFEFTKQKLSEIRKGQDRDYLHGKIDIHESDLSFQEKVKKTYLKAIAGDNDFISIKCYHKNQMLKPEIISNKIISEIKKRDLLT